MSGRLYSKIGIKITKVKGKYIESCPNLLHKFCLRISLLLHISAGKHCCFKLLLLQPQRGRGFQPKQTTWTTHWPLMLSRPWHPFIVAWNLSSYPVSLSFLSPIDSWLHSLSVWYLRTWSFLTEPRLLSCVFSHKILWLMHLTLEKLAVVLGPQRWNTFRILVSGIMVIINHLTEVLSYKSFETVSVSPRVIHGPPAADISWWGLLKL